MQQSPLDKLTFHQLVKKFCTFYETDRFSTVFTITHHLPCPEPHKSSPCCAVFTITHHLPYPEPHKSSPCCPSYFLKILFIINTHLHLIFQKSLSIWFPQQNPVCTSLSPLCPTCSVHLIHLDVITNNILCRQIMKHLIKIKCLCYFKI
jgi:hypothetical protein